MKIVRMYDREERGGWQFAMVETLDKKWFALNVKSRRRVARKADNQYFRFMDTGIHTPARTVEDMWLECESQEKDTTFADLAQKAYLTA